MQGEEITSEYATLKLVDGIIVGAYKDIIIDLEAAKQVVKDRKELTKKQTYPIMINATKVKEVTKEARYYFGSKEGEEYLSAAAILTSSVLATFLANFIIRVNFSKTNIPTRLFNDEKKALEWLKAYK